MSRVESRAQTRARVLEAAKEVFVERGFAGASIEEIAERAGFTKGAVYGNFADKSALFLAVLEQRDEIAIEEISGFFGGPLEDVLDRLRARDQRRTHDERWTILNAEFWLYAMRNPEVRERLAEYDAKARKAYAVAVRAQFKQAGIKLPAHEDDLALIVQILDEGIVLKQRLDPAGIRPGFLFDALLLLYQAAAAMSREREKARRRKPRPRKSIP